MNLPTSILAMADLATPMSIRVAATLSLVERAGSEGATAEKLAADTGTSEPALRRMLDHLVVIGAFELDTDGRYRPTALGAQMGEDAPEGFKTLLDINRAGGRGELAFVDLLHTITTGESAYVHRYGHDFWADLEDKPALRRSFDAQMNWRFRDQAEQIAEGLDWGRFPRILDVGGGDGQLLTAILRAHSGVSGQIVDVELTSAAANKRFAADGLDDRASAVAGSFFDPLPTGFDAYVLSDIVHDWDDEHSRKILTECRKAAGPNGTVVLVEPLLGRGSNTGLDLFMLMCFGGRERTVDQLAALAAETGLTLRATTDVSAGRTALEFTTA